MSDGRSGQKQRTKEYVKFLALKVVVVALNIWEVVAYERVFKTVYDWEIKRILTKWSLTRSGRNERVDCMPHKMAGELQAHQFLSQKHIFNYDFIKNSSFEKKISRSLSIEGFYSCI